MSPDPGVRRCGIDERTSDNFLHGNARLRVAGTLLPSLRQRKELMEQRAKMGDVLLLPQDFSKARGEVMANLDRARDADAKARRKLADLNAQIETLVVPTALLDYANAITKLHKSLGSHAKAMQDLPRLLGEAAQLEAEAAGILKAEVEAFAGAAPLDQAYEMSVRRADETADRLRSAWPETHCQAMS